MIDRAIFLLAGESTRFDEIIPHKSLLEICGQSILERQIIQAANLGISEFMFVVGHKWRLIQSHVSEVIERHSIPFGHITTVMVPDYKTTKTAWGLWMCRVLRGASLVFEGDIVIRHLPILDIIDEHVWLTVGGCCGGGSYVHIRENVQGFFGEKPSGHWVKSAGIFLIWGTFFCDIEDSDKYIDQLIINDPFERFVIPGRSWHEIDTIEDFRCAKKKFMEPVRYQIDPALI
jgi:choline kinase